MFDQFDLTATASKSVRPEESKKLLFNAQWPQVQKWIVVVDVVAEKILDLL